MPSVWACVFPVHVCMHVHINLLQSVLESVWVRERWRKRASKHTDKIKRQNEGRSDGSALSEVRTLGSRWVGLCVRTLCECVCVFCVCEAEVMLFFLSVSSTGGKSHLLGPHSLTTVTLHPCYMCVLVCVCCLPCWMKRNVSMCSCVSFISILHHITAAQYTEISCLQFEKKSG